MRKKNIPFVKPSLQYFLSDNSDSDAIGVGDLKWKPTPTPTPKSSSFSKTSRSRTRRNDRNLKFDAQAGTLASASASASAARNDNSERKTAHRHQKCDDGYSLISGALRSIFDCIDMLLTISTRSMVIWFTRQLEGAGFDICCFWIFPLKPALI